jgi:peptidoglycan/LPS O-acetylase OafA/YrhL
MQPISGRIPELDGLRGIAIATVMACHAGVYVKFGWAPLDRFLSAGWSGVDLFFVLSGFLIGGILLDQRESTGYFPAFYARRVFRILPPYLLVLLGYGLTWLISSHSESLRYDLVSMVGRPMPWWVYLTFTNNIFEAFHGPFYFLPITWSLAVEEQFYLSFPLLVRLLSRRGVTALVGFGILEVMALRTAACVSGVVNQNQAYMLPLFRADILLIGVGCALVARSRPLTSLVRKWRYGLYATLAVLVLAMFRVGWWLPADRESPATPLMEYGLTVLGLFYGGILLTSILACPAWLSRALRWRPLRWLGGVSYFVYLAHQPLLFAALKALPELHGVQRRLGEIAAIVVAYAVTLVAAQLSWRYYESKMLRLGHRWKYGESTRDEEELPPVQQVAA